MSRRTFAIGIVAVLLGFVVIGVGIDRLNGDRLRPEGVAEDWLVAVGDTTRKGVREQSEKDAEEIGDLAFAESLLKLAGHADGERAFTELEVGKAVGNENLVRVPYRLHIHGQDDPTEGVVVLTRVHQNGEAKRGWLVAGLGQPLGFQKLPSEGGAPPRNAPNWLWPLGLAAGLVLTALCSTAVRLASPRP
jgi:hypothetical protein